MRRAMPALVLVLLSASCAPQPATPPAERPADAPDPTPPAAPAAPAFSFVTLAPGLRLDKDARVVEFDGTVPIDCHDPRTPDVYLELVVTGPDSREHESLVLTTVPASLIHAALLAGGFEPGSPGVVRVDADGRTVRTPPTGDRLRVQLVTRDADGAERVADAAEWIVGVASGRVLADAPEWSGFVFAGSRVVERGGRSWYEAEATGTIVGLTTFGSETVGAALPLSPESGIDEPAWIARRDLVPPRGTPVVVRLSPAG